jgi:murein DD-endopeptidase MepM/ murein hydrolase activator NlpD
LLLCAAVAVFGLAGGVAVAGTGGISPGPPPPEPPPPTCQDGGSSASSESFDVEQQSAAPEVKYYGDGGKATLSYEIGGVVQPVDIAVHVLNRDSGEFVRSYCPEDVPPGGQQTVQWDSKTDDGAGAPKGEYEFVLTEVDGTPVDDSGASGDPQFQFRGHIFPLHGTPHYYGDGWGAGRGHRGIDLFENGFPSPCGAPVLAARGGTVKYKRSQAGAAGNYIVIDGNGTSRLYAYLHLQGKTLDSFVSKGSSVKTGEQIASMGASGNASACHLHFELWTSDWNQYDPEPSVREWDTWS